MIAIYSVCNLRRARKRSPPLARHKIRRRPKQKTVQKLKIAWRLCFSRKPFREPCPRMRTPKGVSWRLTEFDAKNPRDDSAGSSDTGSLVLCRFVIPKRTRLRKGGNKKIFVGHFSRVRLCRRSSSCSLDLFVSRTTRIVAPPESLFLNHCSDACRSRRAFRAAAISASISSTATKMRSCSSVIR